MSNNVCNCLGYFLAYDLSNFLKNNEIYYNFILSVLIISCETTSPITNPEQKIIYKPKEETQVIEEKEERKIKDFSNIKSFEGKKISSLQEQYGDFNFSKLEQTFEFHRYNAEGCRIFIQNYSNNKIIIHITIYNLETKKTYNQYQEEVCA